MSIFHMPSLGADMEAGTLVEWLVAPGDGVQRGDVVAVVETQKGAIEIEVFQQGRVRRLLASVGDELPVGEPMAEIDGDGDDAAEVAPPPPHDTSLAIQAPARDAPPATAAPPVPSRAPASPPASPPLASPAARRRAKELGVDLFALQGSGPGGAVVLSDVESGATSAPEAAAGRFGPESMRAAIAAAMARSKREIPHYYLSHEIDLQTASDWLADTNATRSPERRLVMGLLFVRAAALAARKVPEMNGLWRDGAFVPSSAVHAGVAVSLRGGGLVAPALHDVATRSLDALMADFRDLVARARTARLRSSEVADPTITISSLGARGVDALDGVIFPPQVAIVGFGTPRRRPVVVGDEVVPHMTVTATLAADHRVSDGRRGARFLAEIDRRLQTPEAL
ncbi:MAG: dihydrolipoamide acetyltransferase family protein [Pseudomonadota bacterium]